MATKIRKTWKVKSGGKVKQSGDEFIALDRAGNYIGFTASKTVAETMANTGRVCVATIDSACEISRWPLWNDAVDSGARVLVDDKNRQVISLGDSIFMIATDYRSGWVTELITDVELEERYYNKTDECYDLRVLTAGKFRLE